MILEMTRGIRSRIIPMRSPPGMTRDTNSSTMLHRPAVMELSLLGKETQEISYRQAISTEILDRAMKCQGNTMKHRWVAEAYRLVDLAVTVIPTEVNLSMMIPARIRTEATDSRILTMAEPSADDVLGPFDLQCYSKQ